MRENLSTDEILEIAKKETDYDKCTAKKSSPFDLNQKRRLFSKQKEAEQRKGEIDEKESDCIAACSAMAMSLTACGDTSKTGSTAEETAKQEETTKESENTEKAEESTLVYGSGDYTRINPAMDEHCEINVLLFSGLTAHDADDQVIPGLAEKWEYDEDSYTLYVPIFRDGIKWS